MTPRPRDAIFQVTQISVVTSGTPLTNIDAHITTRHGQPSDVVAVTVADVVVYCHDLASVRVFAEAWDAAREVVPAGMPDLIEYSEPNRHQVGVVLWVEGTPVASYNGLSAQANPTGRPLVRVTVGPLTVTRSMWQP